VMSGSRHCRMNAVRMRKENQVIEGREVFWSCRGMREKGRRQFCERSLVSWWMRDWKVVRVLVNLDQSHYLKIIVFYCNDMEPLLNATRLRNILTLGSPWTQPCILYNVSNCTFAFRSSDFLPINQLGY
jgi:hypothetical protein